MSGVIARYVVRNGRIIRQWSLVPPQNEAKPGRGSLRLAEHVLASGFFWTSKATSRRHSSDHVDRTAIHPCAKTLVKFSTPKRRTIFDIIWEVRADT